MKYFIFHLAQNEWENFNSLKSTFFSNNHSIGVNINSNRNLKNLIKKHPELNMNIVLKDYSDIFYFSQFGYIVSERLRGAIEVAGLKDFEFIEMSNIRFMFENDVIGDVNL